MEIKNRINKMKKRFNYKKNLYRASIISTVAIISFTLYFISVQKVAAEIEKKEKVTRIKMVSSVTHKLEYLFDGNLERVNAVIKYSKENGIDPLFTISVIFAESDNRKYATSRVKARGLMQLMKPTAIILANAMGKKDLVKKIYTNPGVLYNPKINIMLGTRFLKDLRGMYKNWKHTLHAYNVGPVAFKYGKRNHRYVNKIMGYYEDFKKKDLEQIHKSYRDYLSYIYRKRVSLVVMK